MTLRVFTKLLGLFVLLLVIQAVAMEFVFQRAAARTAGEMLLLLGRDVLWSGLIALVIALPVAAWVAGGVTARLQRVVAFARRIAEGDLSARLDEAGEDELAEMEAALEQREVRSGRASSLTPGRIFEVNAAPLPSGGALAVLHDVTGIEAAEKSRRDFIANVSHELRTPLTSIQGYVETLVEDPSPNYKLKLQPTRASALIHDAITSLGGIVVDSGVKLESTGAPDSPVMADPDAMNQVFGNLIENALKYGKTGKRIRVGARLLEDEVEFSVRDFGPGMASEHLNRIFERFYRIDKARSRESGGTGLGLAIVKHIVQAHGGRIWAESELGAGAAFHFTLPLAPGAPGSHGPHEALRPAEPAAAARTNG